jgi:hypothetical protein
MKVSQDEIAAEQWLLLGLTFIGGKSPAFRLGMKAENQAVRVW